jgi:hypothetical protein
MAYRRLPEVLVHHAGNVRVMHTLRAVCRSRWPAKAGSIRSRGIGRKPQAPECTSCSF